MEVLSRERGGQIWLTRIVREINREADVRSRTLTKLSGSREATRTPSMTLPCREHVEVLVQVLRVMTQKKSGGVGPSVQTAQVPGTGDRKSRIVHRFSLDTQEHTVARATCWIGEPVSTHYGHGETCQEDCIDK